MSTTRNRKYAALGATLVLAGVGALTVFHGHGDSPVNAAVAASNAAPLTEVDVAAVVAKSVTDYQGYSGRLEAIDKVEIRPLVPGTIVAVHFKDGALVTVATGLVLVPGLVTTVLGMLLLLPPVRAAAGPGLTNIALGGLQRRAPLLVSYPTTFTDFRHQSASDGGDYIDGEVLDVEDVTEFVDPPALSLRPE